MLRKSSERTESASSRRRSPRRCTTGFLRAVEVVSAGHHGEDVAGVLSDELGGAAAKAGIAEIGRQGPRINFVKHRHGVFAGVGGYCVVEFPDQLQNLFLQSDKFGRGHGSVGLAADQVDVEVNGRPRM